MMSVIEKFKLIKMKLDILKLKADGYEWSHSPDDVKEELEKVLAEINEALAEWETADES